MSEKKVSFNELIQSDKPVLVDFFATWCGPCQAMGPVLHDLAGDLGEDGKIIKIDIDKNRAVANHFQITGVPTFMVFKEGKMLWRQSGMQSKSGLKKVMESFA